MLSAGAGNKKTYKFMDVPPSQILIDPRVIALERKQLIGELIIHL